MLGQHREHLGTDQCPYRVDELVGCRATEDQRHTGDDHVAAVIVVLCQPSARRIVTGGQPPATWYYTDDHYDSFRSFKVAGSAH